MRRRYRVSAERGVVLVGMALIAASVAARPAELPMLPGKVATTAPPTLVGEYCARCHNDVDLKGNLSVDDLRGIDLAGGVHTELWEKVLRQVATGQMPPAGKAQPSPAQRTAFVAWLAHGLDARAASAPDPGRATIRRLNRVEYANAVRDLLALDVDVARDLPPDNSGYGFDNIADVLSVSPTLMDRYVAVAGKVARLATGVASAKPFVTSYDVPKDGSIRNSGRPAYNERADAALPLGSRGGGAFRYYARADATYEVAGWLNANTNNETDHVSEDRFAARIPMTAGAHVVGMAFRRALAPDESVQTLRNSTDAVPLPLDPPVALPLDITVDGRRVATLSVPSYRLSPRFSQRNFPRDVLQIDVTGPYGAGKPTDTPSRRAIFSCRPRSASAEAACARTIVAALARRAYRRPVTEADVAPLLRVYARERAGTDFTPGIAAAIEAILVSPRFLFVVERDPEHTPPGMVHRLSDLEIAARLALFLWSSIPDEPLLRAAEQGRLHEPAQVDAQITRMLADPRADALTRNFAGQWLYLRNLEGHRPDPAVFPDFDVRLRQAMTTETQMFFANVLRANRSVLDFIAADYTFLNQRLAEHYRIPGVSGTAFRKVALAPEWHRGGLLGQASILTVTSYGNHTSVVKRGKWILDNMLAAPPPPPPPDVPALQAEHDGRLLTAREQLERHRANPVCASCHVRMDPLGFSHENFDATGALRLRDAGQTIDAGAVMPDGTKFSGIAGLQQILLTRRGEFVDAFTERLMTYALGRGLTATDMPAVRAIGRRAAADGYRIQTIVRGIVASDAFTMRKAPTS